jgi:amino acid adenylation domain-containing protein/non-ribosomal peptide synthase protein (TIGR01720 family)
MLAPSGLVVDDQYALTPMQQGMLFHSLDPRNRGVDVEQVLCTLAEPLDVAAFVRAWEHIVSRYAILRTAFDWEGKPEPVQTVYQAVELPVRILDWRGLTAADQKTHLAAVIDRDRARGFDVRCAPLMRLTIAACGPRAFEVLWSFHHSILDGRSFPILLREVFGVYEGLTRGREPSPAPARQFKAYIDWLGARDPDASRAFWTKRLAGFTAPTPILDSVPPGAADRDERFGVIERRLTADETRQLHAFARTHGLTVGTVVTGAWALLLSRYTGEDDVVFGVTRACRRETVAGADDMVGLFINTVPFRSRVQFDATVSHWLSDVRIEQLAIRAHEHTPLPRIQAWSAVGRGTPIFETLVVFERYVLDSVLRTQGGAWTDRRFAYQGRTNYPLTFVCYDDAEMLLRLEYDGHRLDDAAAQRMIGHLGRLLTGLAETGSRRLADVPMLGDEERAELLPVPQRPSGIQTFCLHERFERRAAETPAAPALTCDGQTLAYDEVNRRANQLAHRLRGLGVGPDVLVGIYMERSVDLVIGILGILKAGGAYLPLDPAYPPDRLKFMLDDAHVSLVVTARHLLGQFPSTGADIVCVNEADDQPCDNPVPVAEPHNLAYVIYTSGSTGRPKGVLITHANVSRLFDASDTWFRFGRDDVWTLFHSYAFDFSVWEIWGALLYGGRLVVVPYWISRAPDAFIDLLERERVTVLNQTPSAFRQLIDADGALTRRPAFALRYVVLGGEALEVSSLRPWFERRGDERPRVINMFGITETTVHVTYRPITQADVDAGAGSVIGVPIADLDVYVLDRHKHLVPVGVTGEIYVGGAGVARGYLDRPNLTRDRFIADPVGGTAAMLYRSGDLGRWLASGELEYRGRIDDQVKVRGFRIELGEIEAVVRQAAGVRDATVVALKETGAEQRLAAYVVLDPKTSVEDIRRFVRGRLPEYMIPAAIVTLDALPLTSNGKIDRRALPAPSAAVRSVHYVAPRNDIERKLAEIWGAVLRRDRVGVEDNFFELGGDSILSIQVIARSRQAGLQLTTRELFKHPTVAALAAKVVPAAVAPRHDVSGVGVTPLTPIGRWFFELELANRNHWNQAFLLQVPADVDAARLESALQAVVAHHDAFRLRFRQTPRGWESRYIESVPTAAIERASLAEIPDDLLAESIESRAASVQASVDLVDGPLVRAVHFDCGPSRPGRLLLVVHHAAVDAVSWRILFEDLESAYAARWAGQTPQFPQRTTSFKAWSERLVAYAESDAKEGLDGWKAVSDPLLAAIPCDRPADDAVNTEGAACTITVGLTAAETDALLLRAATAYGTQINDLLLSALAKALVPWTGRDAVVIDVEGHGREDVFDDVDLSRTVGWFTTMYPVRLEAVDGAPGAIIRRTKEALRQLHHRGLSYGVLRYLTTGVDSASALGAPRQVLFNYLGQIDALVAGSSLFAFAPESTGAWHGADNRRSHLVDILASIVGGRLRVQWTYCTHVHDATTIASVADRYAEALRELVAHCVAAHVVQRTPSDFALGELTQGDVDELTRRFPTLTDAYPLSPMQQLFLSVDALDASPGFEQWEFLLEGPLDPARLRRAWQRIVARHAILRTAFVSVGGAKPYQVVLDAVTVPWREEDWRPYPAAEQEQRLTAFLDADRNSPFDLGQPPLMRITLVRTADAVHRLIWSTHHLLVDGWSWPLIFSELSALYESGADAAGGLETPCSYREYVGWLQRRGGGGDDDRFWRAQLDGVADPTPIPLMPADRQERHDASGEIVRVLSAETTAALGALARSHQVTLGTIVSGAWSLVLAHHSGRSDVVFGASFAGRPDQVPGIETMVGPCVNNLPIRVRVDERHRIGDWLRRLHDQIGELTSYQTTPLTQIHATSSVPTWMRLFDSLLVVQNYVVDARVGSLGPVNLRPLRCPASTNYPATIVVRPGDRLEVHVLRSGPRFGEASSVVAADDLIAVLETLASAEAETVTALLARLPMESRGLAGLAAVERRMRRGPRLAARTEMERALVGIWRELFGGEIGTDENYFELGVHSLMLIRAHERICGAVKPDLPIAALFQYPTVRDLAAHLTASASGRGRQTDIQARAAQQQQAVARRKAQARPNGPQ